MSDWASGVSTLEKNISRYHECLALKQRGGHFVHFVVIGCIWGGRGVFVVMIHFKDAFDNSPSINIYKLSEPYFNHVGHHIYRICHFLGWHIWRWSDINIQINHFSMKQHVDQQGMRCKGRRKSIVFVIECYWHSNHVMLSFQIWGTDSNFIIVSWLSGKFKASDMDPQNI